MNIKRALTIISDTIIILAIFAGLVVLFGLSLKGLWLCAKFGWNLL